MQSLENFEYLLMKASFNSNSLVVHGDHDVFSCTKSPDLGMRSDPWRVELKRIANQIEDSLDESRAMGKGRYTRLDGAGNF